ncbi:MAG: hypothetical protein K5829_05865 [Treponema sp.]|nr:hypothetical protein [Treponema sp.]
MTTKTLNMIALASDKEKDLHLFDIKKVVHTKDDGKAVNDLLSGHNQGWGISRVTGKPRTSTPNGYKASANCESCKPRGHNIRDPKFVEDKKHIDPNGLYKIYTDMGPIEKCYEEIFGEALAEYNSNQTRKSRRIENYLTHILKDQRRGTMKKNSNVDNSRKPCYEFIFEIGNRDHQIEREKAIEILEKFSNEWMPSHYPNLKIVGAYLHADEFTIDPVSKKRIESAPHIHFDFIPIAHCLTAEEKEDFENWKDELKEKEKEDCKKQGKKFNSEEFAKRDWEFERAKRYGKAEMKGLPLQSSLSGACAEMGFRTQGKNTAQIQLERAIRTDLLDLAESYGIEVDRTVNKNAEEKVRIEVYKAREDAKKLLDETKKMEKNAKRIEKNNEKTIKEIERREKNVSGLEEEQKEVRKMEKDLQKEKEKIAPYIERIDTLIEDEKKLKEGQEELKKTEKLQDEKEESFRKEEMRLAYENDKLENKKAEIKTSLEELEEKENQHNLRKEKLDLREDSLNRKEKENEEARVKIEADAKLNFENKELNEKNAKELSQKFENFGPLEEKFKKYTSMVKANEMIKTNIKGIEKQFMDILSIPEGSWYDKVEMSVSFFTEQCQKIISKFHDAIRGFKNFLQGKTSHDFRKLADDMDRNGTRTFEEYESRWASESLDWQVKERKQKLALKPHRRELDWER